MVSRGQTLPNQSASRARAENQVAAILPGATPLGMLQLFKEVDLVLHFFLCRTSKNFRQNIWIRKKNLEICFLSF